MVEWMVERAKEELELLEALHPNRLDSLKLELKSFISNPPTTDHLPFFFDNTTTNELVSGPPPPPPYSDTQGSSNRRKRKSREKSSSTEGGHHKKQHKSSGEDRVEMALQRARACLARIRLLKQSFCA